MIEEVIKQLKVPGKLIYLTQYGSHLYGLNIENSDLDFRGVFIPSKEDIILKKDVDEYNTELEITINTANWVPSIDLNDVTVYFIKEPGLLKKVKVDVKLFSIYKFLKLCSKGDTNALDVLFSVDMGTTLADMNKHVEQYYDGYYSDTGLYDWWIIQYIKEYANKLINTNNLTSPITYAFRQATKYSIKGSRRFIMLQILEKTKLLSDIHTVQDIIPLIQNLFDDKFIRIDELDNKGKIEKYLYVCGVQHQFNLSIQKFKQRLQDKIDKEYISQRTIDAADGNDWKALSHALRILLEVKELLNTTNIVFPSKYVKFLMDVKLGKVSREEVDNFFNEYLEDILNQVQENKLGWKYDEVFWNKFLLEVI